MAVPVPVLQCECELGEGPVWAYGRLWFVDILAPCIHSYDPLTQLHQSWPAPEAVGFVVPATGGGLVTGLKSGLYHFSPETGRYTELSVLQDPDLDWRINDGAVDASGYLWFGTLDESERDAIGALYRLDDDGQCRPRDKGYVVSNGPAFSPDGLTMYHTDTLAQTIYAFDLKPAGMLADKRVFARIERPGTYPDGNAVDSEGCLWVGLFGGWGAERYAPSGERLEFIEFPCSRVTKLAFGGPDLKTLYATTARKGLSPTELDREPQAGSLFAFDAAVPGLASPPVRHGMSQD